MLGSQLSKTDRVDISAPAQRLPTTPRSATMQRIPTYLSHSYRAEDRPLNNYLWELLWDHNFLVHVDPQSDEEVAGTFSVPHLEVMMRQSACFVAAITHRPEHASYRCSPYMLWECGLAIQARKPRLLLVEQGVTGRYFPKGDPTIQVFDRQQLSAIREQISDKLRALTQHARLIWDPESQLLRKVGIVVGGKGIGVPKNQVSIEEIRALVYETGYDPEFVDLDFKQNFEFALKLDTFDFVVVDVTPGALPEWVYPYIHGRFIPSVKLFHLSDGEAYRGLPRLIATQLIPGPATGSDTVLFWKDKNQLVSLLRLQLRKFLVSRKPFHSPEAGTEYFSSLGLNKARIFISNSNSSNDLALRLTEGLRLRKLDPFQYRTANRIKSGRPWRPELKTEVFSSDIFIALMTKDYFDSPYCQEELQHAIARLDRGEISYYSYFLERGMTHERQAKNLHHIPLDEQCKTIISDVEASLIKTASLRGAQPTRTRSPTKGGSVDVAIATIIDEEYRAVFNSFENVSRPVLPRGRPDLHGWQVGELVNPSYRSPYRVLFGKAQRPTNPAAVNMIREIVELWRPRYIILVGIAGGIDRDGFDRISLGDVIVSNSIYGYEYGKVTNGAFLPRPDLVFHVDGGLLAGAQALSNRNPDWASQLVERYPQLTAPPRLVVGPVASGDKIIDDATTDFFDGVISRFPSIRAVEMEGVGAAQAIESARAAGHNVGFIMVRGISDLPSRKSDSGRRSRKKIKPPQDRPSVEREGWKEVAAESASAFAIQFIKCSWPMPPSADG